MIRSIIKRLIPKPYRQRLRRMRRQFRDFHYLKWHKPILVYHMGKVGSTSVYVSLLACGVKAVQLSGIKPAYMREFAGKGRINIITLVREPIGRTISWFFENFDRLTGVAYDQATCDLAALSKTFLSLEKAWKPSPWFDEVMKEALGVDVYDYPFPQEQGSCVIETEDYRILILKLELNDAIKEEVISDFLNLSDFKLIRSNVTQDKAYAETYQAFIQTIRLSEAYVEGMCNDKYTRHFYGDAEIEAIRSKWLRRD